MMKIETQTVTRVTLSETQARMLLFFAGVREDPYGDTRTTRALITRKLVARREHTDRYRLTDLGRQVAAELDHLALADNDRR